MTDKTLSPDVFETPKGYRLSISSTALKSNHDAAITGIFLFPYPDTFEAAYDAVQGLMLELGGQQPGEVTLSYKRAPGKPILLEFEADHRVVRRYPFDS